MENKNKTLKRLTATFLTAISVFNFTVPGKAKVVNFQQDGIIRNGVLEKIPSIIVEHAYLDNKNDYDNFLFSDEKIKKLAIADMKGIVNFFKLKKQNAQNN